MWFRTQKRYMAPDGEAVSLRTDVWDALRFKAKKNCYFLGAGMLKNAASKEFVLEMKFRVIRDGDEDSQPTVIEVDST